MTSVAEAATKREGFGCRALSVVSAQLFGVTFVKNLSAVSQLPKLTIPNTGITPVWESQKPDFSAFSQLYNFACAPAPETDSAATIPNRFSKGGGDAFLTLRT